MNGFKRLSQVMILTLIVMLSACYSENNVANSEGVDVSVKHHQKYSGKPHAPINMRYKLISNKTVSIGKLIQYQVYFSATVDADDLQVRYKTKDGLVIQNSQPSISFGEQSKGKKNLLELEVIPQQEGMFYIYLSATLSSNGRKQSRSFAIPVQVGEPQLNPALKLKSAAPQQTEQTQPSPGIISMPAIERTR